MNQIAQHSPEAQVDASKMLVEGIRLGRLVGRNDGLKRAAAVVRSLQGQDTSGVDYGAGWGDALEQALRGIEAQIAE